MGFEEIQQDPEHTSEERSILDFEDVSSPERDAIRREAWAHGQDTFVVNGKTVEFFGLVHDGRTLDIYEKELDMLIRESSCVLLEVSPLIYSEDSPIIKQYFLPHLDSTNPQNIEAVSTAKFFAGISALAEEHSKRVYISDPINTSYSQFFEEGGDPSLTPGKEADAVIEGDRRKLALIFAGLGVALPVSRYFTGSGKKGTAKHPSKRDEPRSGGMTRRKFLRATLYGAVLGGMSCGIDGSLVRDIFSQNALYFDRTDTAGVIVYSFRDYRDVCIAKGIEKLTKNIESNKPIVAIYGADHTKPVRYYLEHPKERELRYQLYMSLRHKIPTELLGYDADASKKWTAAERISLEV